MKYPQVLSMPSAVTNWLEEQLEARGIDAVLYTRYVLSLLHTHTVDVIYSDEDLHFSPLNKESRRSGGGRKRFRRSSEWWKHAHLDAEKLKRSAAVQCLMSASDQNCEIESLVDELCEKLKEIEDPDDVNPAPTQEENERRRTVQQQQQQQQVVKKVSPKEQAEKYYAAFPALRRGDSSPSKIISLIPKWIQSPKKKAAVGSRKSKGGGKFDSESMKNRGNSSKQRYGGYLGGRTKKDHLGGNMFSNRKQLNRIVPTQPDKSNQDQCVVDNEAAWNNEDQDQDVNMYDDLPVNIRELLDSPTPPEDEIMMNLANDKLRDETMKTANNFISGNLVSSIWSNNTDTSSMDDVAFDNRFNSVLDEEESVGLDRKFRSITIEEQPRDYWRYDAQNETNAYFERHSRAPGGGGVTNIADAAAAATTITSSGSFLEGFHSLPAWSNATEDDECFENQHLLNRVAVSLMKINHNKEKSCFAEIMPSTRKQRIGGGARQPPASQSFNPFSFESGAGALFPCTNRKEDLLTSERSHFRPINEKVDVMQSHGEYADGATFVISNNLDKVNYKRSESGSMYLESEFGQIKKYCSVYLEEAPTVDSEFVLKFSVCQNDKACQTEENDEWLEQDGLVMVESKVRGIDEEEECVNVEELKICTCPLNKMIKLEERCCAVHPERPESMMAEVMWRSCDKCNNNNTLAWNADWMRKAKAQLGSEWDDQNLRNIWNGGELCHACLNTSGGGGGSGGGRPPPDANLRQDILQDGEQLLSDLSTMQKCYQDDLPITAELSCDIADFFIPKERKRRHSYITGGEQVTDPSTNSRSSWSFASRLEEDCLIQMSTIPTLRSVTL